MTWDDYRRIVLALPGVEDASTHGRPSLKVRGRFLTNFRNDNLSVTLPIDFDEREMLIDAAPETFSLNDHLRGYRYVIARLETLEPGTAARLVEQAWRTKAGKRVVATYDAARAASGSSAE